MDRDTKRLVSAAIDQGWEFEMGRNHAKLRRGADLIVISVTPSDQRALRNLRALMRRYGISV